MRVGPKSRLSLSKAKSRSGRLVRAIGMPPACRRRATSVASAAEGAASRRPSGARGAAAPAISMESLTLKGRRAGARWRACGRRARGVERLVGEDFNGGVDLRIDLGDPVEVCLY